MRQASSVGLIIGAILLIVGFLRFNPRLWMPGILLFGIGLILHYLDSSDDEA